MNEPEEDAVARELVPEPWRQLDDTLADGSAPAEVPAEAKSWLASQRFVHGLLRAMHTADAAAREARITGLLERIDGERSQPAVTRRHWFAVAAAALLLATAAIYIALPAQLPTAEAAVERIVRELARDVDRRFRVDVTARGLRGVERAHHEFLLVTRPGMQFRLDGKFEFAGMSVGELRIGCDGSELWLQPASGRFRHAVPLAEHQQLLDMLGDVFDLGYLDVHDLVRRLPADYDVRVVGRERSAAGRDLLRIEAVPSGRGEAPLRSASITCDEETGMIHQLTADTVGRVGIGRIFSLEYLGTEPAGLVDYKKPW